MSLRDENEVNFIYMIKGIYYTYKYKISINMDGGICNEKKGTFSGFFLSI